MWAKKVFFVAATAFSTLVWASSDTRLQNKIETTVLPPGATLVAGDLAQNEFYIIDKDGNPKVELPSMKNKPTNATTTTTPAQTTVTEQKTTPPVDTTVPGVPSNNIGLQPQLPIQPTQPTQPTQEATQEATPVPSHSSQTSPVSPASTATHDNEETAPTNEVVPDQTETNDSGIHKFTMNPSKKSTKPMSYAKNHLENDTNDNEAQSTTETVTHSTANHASKQTSIKFAGKTNTHNTTHKDASLKTASTKTKAANKTTTHLSTTQKSSLTEHAASKHKKLASQLTPESKTKPSKANKKQTALSNLMTPHEFVPEKTTHAEKVAKVVKAAPAKTVAKTSTLKSLKSVQKERTPKVTKAVNTAKATKTHGFKSGEIHAFIPEKSSATKPSTKHLALAGKHS